MTALFGLSQSLWQMILFRCMAGVFAGTVVSVNLSFPVPCLEADSEQDRACHVFRE
jgi:MFS family permease